MISNVSIIKHTIRVCNQLRRVNSCHIDKADSICPIRHSSGLREGHFLDNGRLVQAGTCILSTCVLNKEDLICALGPVQNLFG